jgi:hypothetical protein
MAARPVTFENGEYKLGKPFDNPEMIDFMGLGPRRMVDHEHEEPVTFGIFFKICQKSIDMSSYESLAACLKGNKEI